mmetsp:Transcript_68948/g.194460  ORF Transcript_68948/g.194460 Transcript_68948/m.194460 type:complete len:217 (-) Transcript_68948:183-833(-)
MGSGASSQKTAEAAGPSSEPPPMDNMEAGVQWLMNAVEKEKQEKEWLAAKYDESCAEVNALNRELAYLRNELKQVGSRSQAGAVGTGQDQASPSSAPAAASSEAKLRDRRNMKLKVDTPGPVSVHAAPSVLKLPAESTTTSTAAPPQQEDAELKEPMSALLRRRQENWEAPAIQEVAAQMEKQLSIKAFKVQSLGDMSNTSECPASPKRMVKREEF